MMKRRTKNIHKSTNTNSTVTMTVMSFNGTRKKNANIVLIYVSPDFLKAHPREYYPIIKILGDNIKKHLL